MKVCEILFMLFFRIKKIKRPWSGYFLCLVFRLTDDEWLMETRSQSRDDNWKGTKASWKCQRLLKRDEFRFGNEFIIASNKISIRAHWSVEGAEGRGVRGKGACFLAATKTPPRRNSSRANDEQMTRERCTSPPLPHTHLFSSGLEPP